MTIFYVVSVDGQINWLGNRIDFPKYRCLLNENESRQTNQYQKQEQKHESGLHLITMIQEKHPLDIHWIVDWIALQHINIWFPCLFFIYSKANLFRFSPSIYLSYESESLSLDEIDTLKLLNELATASSDCSLNRGMNLPPCLWHRILVSANVSNK